MNFAVPLDRTVSTPCVQRSSSGRCDWQETSLRDLDMLYRGPLHAFFRRRGCTSAETEDLVQDTFLRTLSYSRSRKIEKIKPFVFQTAANLLRDLARSARRRQTVSLETSDPGTIRQILLIDIITPERVVEGRQEVASIAKALQKLDERTQTIFVMSRLERYCHRDIASHLGVSVSLVEKSVRSASRHLETYTIARSRSG